MSETETNRFEREPWANTDEDGETGYVSVTASTPTAEAASAFLLGRGAREALGCDDGPYGRRVKAGAKPKFAALTVRLPASYERLGQLPVRIANLMKAGLVTGWWEFDGLYDLTEDLDPPEYEALSAARDAEDRRRAREDRGPWWWRFRCWLGDGLLNAGQRTTPNDRSSVGWREGDKYVIHQVRGWGKR